MATQKMIAFSPETVDTIYKYFLSRPAGEILPLLRELEKGIGFDAQIPDEPSVKVEQTVDVTEDVVDVSTKKRGKSAKLVS